MPFDTTDIQDAPQDADTDKETADASDRDLSSAGQNRMMYGDTSKSSDPPPEYQPKPTGGEKQRDAAIVTGHRGESEKETGGPPVSYEGKLSRR